MHQSVTHPETDPDDARRRTQSLSIAEGSLWGVMTGWGDAFLSPYALFLKAGNQALALLSALPAILGALASLAGAHWVERRRDRKGILYAAARGQGWAWFPLLTTLFLPSAARVPALLGCVGVYVFIGGLLGPAWNSLMGDVVPSEGRGAYFGRRARIIILVTFCATSLAGLWLSWFQGTRGEGAAFLALFAGAGAIRLYSAGLFSGHFDPPYAGPPPGGRESFAGFLRELPRDNFGRFTLFMALMSGAVAVAAPFFAVWMLRDLHWSYAQFTASAIVHQAFQFLALGWWGRMGDRHGNRTVLVAVSRVLTVLPCLWLLTDRFWLLMAIQMFAGIAWSGYSNAALNFLFDAVPSARRPRTVAYYNVIIGVFALAGGLIGGWLATHLPAAFTLGPMRIELRSALPLVFLISGVSRAVAAAALLPRIREVRAATEPLPAGALLLRIGRPEGLLGSIWSDVSRLAATFRRGSGG